MHFAVLNPAHLLHSGQRSPANTDSGEISDHRQFRTALLPRSKRIDTPS